jgi:hypothetical protein
MFLFNVFLLVLQSFYIFIIRQFKSRRTWLAGHVARIGEEKKSVHVARIGEEKKSVQCFVGNPEGKRPLGRPRRRWEDGIRMGLRKIGWGSVEWIQSTQDRGWCRAVVNTVMNLRVLAPRS